MKQGRMLMPFVLAALLALAVAPATRVDAAARKSVPTVTQRKGAALRQFTGTVTALDKAALTVEKSGAGAKSMVFALNSETKTSGELAKDARVTVWYRDEDGRLVARKVVVKVASSDTAR